MKIFNMSIYSYILASPSPPYLTLRSDRENIRRLEIKKERRNHNERKIQLQIRYTYEVKKKKQRDRERIRDKVRCRVTNIEDTKEEREKRDGDKI